MTPIGDGQMGLNVTKASRFSPRSLNFCCAVYKANTCSTGDGRTDCRADYCVALYVECTSLFSVDVLDFCRFLFIILVLDVRRCLSSYCLCFALTELTACSF